MKTNYFTKKIEGCEALVAMRVKHINKTHIEKVATKLNMPVATLEHAWENFQESGGKYVDRRQKSSNPKALNLATPNAKKLLYTKMRKVSYEEASMIIREYMTTKVNAVDLVNNHQITANQFYSWIHELNTSGTLFGHRILDPKKYAKLDVKDVIWLNKYKNSKRKSLKNLTEMQVVAYRQVANILLHYLPIMEKKNG